MDYNDVGPTKEDVIDVEGEADGIVKWQLLWRNMSFYHRFQT